MRFFEYALQPVATIQATGISTLQTPEDSVAYWKEVIEKQPWHTPLKECVVTVLLTKRKRIMGHNLVSIGTESASLISIREVLAPVVASGASSFVFMHSHPSGDIKPSEADTITTKLLCHAARILQTPCLDHVIVSPGDGVAHFSFLGSGLLAETRSKKREASIRNTQGRYQRRREARSEFGSGEGLAGWADSGRSSRLN